MDYQQRPMHAPGAAHEVASVPRRYGAGTLLVVTAVFGLLFTFFRATQTPAAAIICVCLFLTAVGVAQAIGGPRNARIASALAGGLTLPAIVIGIFALRGGTISVNELILALVWNTVFGLLLGYVTGVLVAGVFLIMRYADAVVARLTSRKGEVSKATDPAEPSNDADQQGGDL